MGLRPKFAEILERAERGENSSLECTINGEIYLRNFRCRERLLLLGGGHICQPLCSFASALDFSVTVADDRPSFVTRERFPDAGTLLCDSFPAQSANLVLQSRTMWPSLPEDTVGMPTVCGRSSPALLQSIWG